MKRMTAKDFDQELLDLYDYYAHGIITKREFLDQAGRFAVGGVTAAMLLNMLSPDYALAEQVSFNDPDILAEYVTYPPHPTAMAMCAPIRSNPRMPPPACPPFGGA